MTYLSLTRVLNGCFFQGQYQFSHSHKQGKAQSRALRHFYCSIDNLLEHRNKNVFCFAKNRRGLLLKKERALRKNT
jgi:hypothetical protein